MSWDDWLTESSEADLEIADGRILVDPSTFQPFVVARVRMNLTPEMEAAGDQACIDHAMRLVEDKIK